MRRLAPLVLLTATALAACGSGAESSTSAASTSAESTSAASTSVAAEEHGAGGGTGTAAAASSVDAGLAAHHLTGKSVVEIVDALDRTNTDRETGLGGSVRMDQLVLSVGDDQKTMPMPADKTYVSIAPYLTQTHECFAHHLSGCQGEQVGQEFDVTITDSTGKSLYSGTQKSYENGFFGIWLPRDVTGTITVSGLGKKGSVPFGTRASDPTCITTLQLV